MLWLFLVILSVKVLFIVLMLIKFIDVVVILIFLNLVYFILSGMRLDCKGINLRFRV